MRTMLDIITRAARLIGVASVDEALDADAGREALAALNDIFHAIPLPDYADLGMTDPAPIEPHLVEYAMIVLASRLAPVFSLPGPDPSAAMTRLRASVLVIPPATIPAGLSRMPSQRRYGYR